jgi:hypothetical protein
MENQDLGLMSCVSHFSVKYYLSGGNTPVDSKMLVVFLSILMLCDYGLH